MMKRLLLLTALVIGALVCGFAQDIVLNFDSASKSTQFQFFGGAPLEGQLSPIIENPDKSGVNTSDSVCVFYEAAGMQAFAGGFSNPDPSTPVDGVNSDTVFMDVWTQDADSVTLKFEPAGGGAPSWEQTLAIPTQGAWTRLAFDLKKAGEAAGQPVGTGTVWGRIVIFFDLDFTVPGPDSAVHYVDNITTNGSAPTSSDVTFIVDMNSYAGSFTQPYVAGAFNGWSADANPMSDANMDGIWEATISMPAGEQEYKFQLDGWADDDKMLKTDVCVKVDPSGQFVNRVITVNGPASLDTVCFSSCYACGNQTYIDVELGFDASFTDIDTANVQITGGGNFGAPSTDSPFILGYDAMTGTWKGQIRREKGFTSYFTFVRAACGDFSCKEDISGQPCADPGNFNDRQWVDIQDDTVAYKACFGNCDESTCGLAINNQVPVENNLFGMTYDLIGQAAVLTFEGSIATEKQITVIDLAGRVVFQTTVQVGTDQLTVPMSAMANGVYVIQANTATQRQTQKFMK